MTEEGHRYAYLLTRLPATYAAICEALTQIQSKISNHPIESFLDAGAGPGTGSFAAKAIFDSIKQFTLLEIDKKFIEIGKELMKQTSFTDQSEIKWENCDLKEYFSAPPHDLVLLSYVVNELVEKEMLELIDRLWNCTKKILLIIEPGTPKGFERILRIREKLLKGGGHLLAPCPHQSVCPMKNSSDWCHFSSRLSRSQEHCLLKEASLGYEDEKFCYLAISKFSLPTCHARILRTPQKKSGHIIFHLCSQKGLHHQTISRKEGENYLMSKKLNWGDELVNFN